MTAITVIDHMIRGRAKINGVYFGNTNHFDHRTRSIYLTPPTMYNNDLESQCTAAHEAGHALQGYWIEAYKWLIDFTGFVMGFVFAAIVLNQIYFKALAIQVGYLVILYLYRLALEADASRRALIFLHSIDADLVAARKIFRKAFLTYIIPF